MKFKEFSEETGASQRQLDYWLMAGMPLLMAPWLSGSGNPREYDERAIPRVKLLVWMSAHLQLYVDIMIMVFHQYEAGELDLGVMKLVWTPETGE
jgi:DNA-binding transcriptional MerR regulator